MLRSILNDVYCVSEYVSVILSRFKLILFHIKDRPWYGKMVKLNMGPVRISSLFFRGLNSHLFRLVCNGGYTLLLEFMVFY